MDAFSSLFDSHFADPHRALANSLGGFVDHATRFGAGVFAKSPLSDTINAALLNTQALSLRAQQTQQALGLSLGAQKLGTSQTTAAQTKALDRIRRNEATLKGDALIEDDHERQRLYALLYPTGTLKYYTTARLGTELADRLSEYLTRTEAEKPALGTGFVKRTLEALAPFRKTRETQVAGLSTTDTARDDRHALIALLDEQCDYNYHLLSAHFRQELARPAAFWNPMFYIRATTPVVVPVPVVPMVPPAPTAGA